MAGAKKTAAPMKKAPADKPKAPARPAAKKRPLPRVSDDLSPKMQLFCHEWLRDLNATQAYWRTHPGCNAMTARTEGNKLLQHPKVKAEIARLRAELAGAIQYDVETMLRREAEIAFADPRELVEHVVECCRYCHGIAHGYQRTRVEFTAAAKAHMLELAACKTAASRKALGEFDTQGGIGWDPRRAPHADCPECHGRGVGRTIVHDTRHLSPAAAALYAGMKETKEGVQVLMHDQATARERLERHLGLFEKDNRQKNDLAAQLAEFVGGIHQSGAGRLVPKARAPK